MIAAPIALACVPALYGLLKILPLRQLYESVEWPVVVLVSIPTILVV